MLMINTHDQAHVGQRQNYVSGTPVTLQASVLNSDSRADYLFTQCDVTRRTLGTEVNRNIEAPDVQFYVYILSCHGNR